MKPQRIAAAFAALFFASTLSAQSPIVYSPAVLPMADGQLLTLQSGVVAVESAPGVVLSIQPDCTIETRPVTAINIWEQASRVGSSLLRYDGAGCLRFIFLQELTPPKPPAQPAPVESPFHVDPGPLTIDRVKQVINATGTEFLPLLQAYPTNDAANAAAEEFLRRVIWHLHLAGYDAARQKNPSGAISLDKFCVRIDGAWQAVDLGSLGYAGHAEVLVFQLISGAQPVDDAGLAD